MADPARRLMTPEEFFEWQLGQDELYELVDGIPVPRHRMMTGSSSQHDIATANMIGILYAQLKGSRCRVTTADTAIRTSIRGLRRPDVMVECAEPVRDTYEALEPRLVVEVASPSTSAVDKTRKLEEYKRHPTLDYILLVETAAPEALLYQRVGGEWSIDSYEGLDAIIEMPTIGVRLPLADVYERMPPGPRRGSAAESAPDA